MRLQIVFSSLCVFVLPCGAFASTFTSFTAPQGQLTRAADINSHAQIVGSFNVVAGVPPVEGPTHGFLWADGIFRTLDVPGSSSTTVNGINDHGEIVGTYVRDGETHGFLFANGVFTSLLDVPGASSTTAEGINNYGQIVGNFVQGGVTRAYLMTDLKAIQTFNVSGASSTQAYDINDTGQIVGSYSSGSMHGYVLDRGTFTTIDVPGAFGTVVFGINNSGDMVGSYNLGTTQAFLWRSGAFSPVDSRPQTRFQAAFAISDHDETVGYFSAATTSEVGFVWSPAASAMQVNSAVSVVAQGSSFETASRAGCPSQFAARFNFTATVANKSASTGFRHLFMQIATLTNGNMLLNADLGPAGVAGIRSAPRTGGYANGLLSPGEIVEVPLSVCLTTTAPFQFLVDVLATAEAP